MSLIPGHFCWWLFYLCILLFLDDLCLFSASCTYPAHFCFIISWVALEFIRAHLFTGFGWVMLGHSQYKNLWLIQIADKTGVYGVSFLVILVNLLIFETWRARSLLLKANIIVIAILSVVLIYGFWVTGQKKHYEMVRVGVVQPNIPLAVDWDESRKALDRC